MTKLALLLFSFLPLFSFEDYPGLEERLPVGIYHGLDNNGKQCLVEAAYTSTGPFVVSIKIGATDCLEKKNCINFWGRSGHIGGGGCFHLYNINEFEIYYSNGETPQGPPAFCSRRFTPGGFKVRTLGPLRTVERNKSDQEDGGTVITSCTF